MTRFLISICNSAVNVVLLLAFTRLLPPAWFGELSYARGIVAFAYALAFDWLRLSITRYWAGEAEGRDVRRSAISALAGFGVAAILPLGVVAALFGTATLGPAMMVAIAANIALQGYNELRIAIARAECDDSELALLMLPRAGLTLVLAIGASLAGMGPLGILVALAAAQCGSLAYLAVARRPLHLRRGLPDRGETRRYLRFGGFIVLSTAANSATALALATLVISQRGPAEYAAYALTTDLLARTMGVVGLALELALLPLALTALSLAGRAAAQQVLQRNAGLTVALMAPMLLGFWLVAPAFAATALGADYRDGFVALSGLVAMQAAFTSGQQFVLNQSLFVAERTGPSFWCVAAGSLVAIGTGALLVPSLGATGIALAQLAGAAVTFLVQAVIVTIVIPSWPPLRSVAAIGAACAAMAVVLWPLRAGGQGALVLAGMVGLGAAVYALVLWVLDFDGVRARVLPRIERWRQPKAAL